MTSHRIEELLELLAIAWQQQPETQLLELLSQLANEAGFQQALKDLSDDVLIYQLKMRQYKKTDQIPGLQKDEEEDFKTAILKARGILPEE